MKEYAAVSHHGNLKIIQQEAPSECLNPSVVELTSLVPYSSDKCGEAICSKPVQNFSLQHGETSKPICDQEIDSTSDFEGASNLNLKANQSVNLRAECEKKKISIMQPVTPRPTDSTGEVEDLSNKAEELCYSFFSRSYITPIWS